MNEHRYWRFVYRGACLGGAAGAAYATVETLFAVLLRSALFYKTFSAPSVAFDLLLLGLYPTVGALIGAVAAAALAPFSTRTEISLGSGFQAILIALACATNAIGLPALSRLVLFGTTLVIVVAATWRIDWIANPWTSSFLLLAPLWVKKEALNDAAAVAHATWWIAPLFACGTVIGVLRTKGRWRSSAWVAPIALLTVTALTRAIPDPPIRDQPPDVSPPANRTPNVVLIVLDTVRADHLSVYGYPHRTTPVLEQFARSATVYERAYSPANATLPAHASLFTGLWPSEHGARFDERLRGWRPLGRDAATLAEILAAKGYATSSIAANHTFLGSYFGLDRGFQFLDARPPSTPFSEIPPYYLRAAIAHLIERALDLPVTAHLLARSASDINKSVRARIDRLAVGARPFLLFVNYMDAHSVCLPPEPFASMFPGRDRSLPFDFFQNAMLDVLSGRDRDVKITQRQQRHLVSQYDGALAYMDWAFGNVMDALRSHGLLDDTLVILTADHGEVFGARGIIGHGSSNYDDQIRVPLLIKSPGQERGRIIRDPVSTTVVYDWVLETTKVARQPPYRAVVTEAYPLQGPSVGQSLIHSGRAIVDAGYKFIMNSRGPIELYDLSRDPSETDNLAITAGMEPVIDHMRGALARWEVERRASMEHLPVPRPDPETARRLRSLGYVH